ncbi:leucine-rich repeat domain-containing protein, partial [Streptomyces radiopugnans]
MSSARKSRTTSSGSSSKQVLYLRGLGAENLGPPATDLSDVRWVDLADNRLSELPDWLFDLPKLRWLDVSGNQLTGLPPALCGLSTLTRLNV